MSIPGAASPLFLATTAGAADAFSVAKSLRFNSGDSAYLNFQPSAAGNRRTWTWSAWVKRSENNNGGLFGNYYSDDSFGTLFFNGDQLQFSANTTWFKTTQVFRDFSSFFHIVLAVDTTLATAGDRVRLYINGSEVTNFATENNPSQNANLGPNNSAETRIGRDGSNYFNGYLAEVNFIDGQALAPTDFGETDANGVWQAKEFAGAYTTDTDSRNVYWDGYWGGSAGSEYTWSGGGAFNGSTSTGYTRNNSAAEITWTPPSAIAISSSLQVWVQQGQSGQVKLNGSTVATNNNQWSEIATSGNLTSLSLVSGAGNAYAILYAVKVDGTILVNAQGANSFRLPFTDNSTTQALGYDAAVTAPTLNPKGGMDVVTYTGNAGTQSIGGLALQPDLVWIKDRTNTGFHSLFDTVRGATKTIFSNATNAEETQSGGVTAFNSDGFSLGSWSIVNAARTYVAWCWKAGGAAVSNTDGTITSQVSASTDYGFSVCTFTSPASGNFTFGHGLSTAPSLVFMKDRENAGNWHIYHSSVSTDTSKYLILNSSGALNTYSNVWGAALPTSSVFGLGVGASIVANADAVAYCWSEVAGFSKFGSYSGGTNPKTITTGFKPRFLIFKRTNSTNHWILIDSARGGTQKLAADLSVAENDNASIGDASQNIVEFLADGFKLTTTNAATNVSGGTYIYAAYADRPGNNWTPNNLVAASNPVYSSNNTGNTNSGLGWDKGFNGLGPSGSGGYVETSNGGTGTTLTLNVPFTKLEFAGNGSGFEFNGTSVSISGAYTFTDISSSITSPLTSIKITSLSVLSAVRVDGVILADGDPPSIDSLVDSPSNGTQTDTGIGGEVVGNYAVLNPLAQFGSNNQTGTLSNGNLDWTTSSTNYFANAVSTIAAKTGKYYVETVCQNVSNSGIGFVNAASTNSITGNYGLGAPSDGWLRQSTVVNNNNSNAVTGMATLAVGDIIGLALDLDNGKAWWSKNGVFHNSGNPTNGTNATVTFTPGDKDWLIGVSLVSPTAPQSINFGQRAFAFSAPTNFKAINTASLPTPTIADGSKYFDTKLWTGNGSTRSITGYNFSPDFAWIKQRSGTDFHSLIDIIRGGTKVVFSNTAIAEETQAGAITAFNSDGFSLGGWQAVNKNTDTFVGWAWDGGNSNNTYTVTVSGGKFYIDGVQQPTLTLAEGSTYKFDQADSTNSSHPLRFSTTSDGTHGGGSEYTTGVTTAGTPGSAGAFTQIVIAASAPTLYAYCTNHSGMGFQVNTSDKGGYTIPVGGLNSSVYNQSAVWSGMFSPAPSGSGQETRTFNGEFTGTGGYQPGYMNGGGSWVPTGGLTYYSTVEVYDEVDQKYAINGGTQAAIALNQWVTIASTTSPSGATLTSSDFTRISDASTTHGPKGIKIDGKILVDSGVSVTNVPSIASQVMASPESGFSIVSWTGTSSTDQKIGHGLNAAPEIYILRPTDTAFHWHVYTTLIDGSLDYLNLDKTDAKQNASVTSLPTSSVFTNRFGTGNYIAYCFAPVEGYSSMGTYTGNGSSSGPFVYTGFKVSWLMVKNTSTGGTYYDWKIIDAARNPTNFGAPNSDSQYTLFANTSGAEQQWVSVDLLSNGFRIIDSSVTINNSGSNFVYLAFASNPFASNGGLAR